jgi:integrase
MPRHAASATRGLIKRHRDDCATRRYLDRCDCPWRGKYRAHEVLLAKWAGQPVKPRDAGAAVTVLRRMQAAVDAGEFDPNGERAPLGDDTSLRAFITEYKSRYAEKHDLSQASLYPMLDVIARGRLGGLTLEELAGNPSTIEDWLDAPEKDPKGRARTWSAKTYNAYHGLLHTLCERATVWTVKGVARMAHNPMKAIDCKVAAQPGHFRERHLDEDVEDRLFAACDTLNRPAHPTTKAKLTQAIADDIRTRLAAGELGVAVARRYAISPAVVSSIKHGDIWNPERVVGTKGTEMRRRLVAAFDAGLRAGEMLQITLAHVNWRLQRVRREDGTELAGYQLALPPELTKGGKRTGETQYVFVATERGKAMLEARRFQLKNNKPTQQFVFGDEAGRQVKGFRRMWRELFELAGLTWGRDHGVVWHTIRHEYISRVAELTDPVIAQQLARHANLATTELYFNTRRDRQLSAAAGLSRR